MPCDKTSMDFLSELILHDESGNGPRKPKPFYLCAKKGPRVALHSCHPADGREAKALPEACSLRPALPRWPLLVS